MYQAIGLPASLRNETDVYGTDMDITDMISSPD